MKTSSRIISNTGFLYARMAITIFISLYSTRLILAALGVEEYGVFTVVGGAIAMLTFLNNAMTSATQRFISYAEGEGDEKKQKAIFNVSIVYHFIIGLIIVLILEGSGYFLFKYILNIDPLYIKSAKYIYQFLIVSTFFRIISVPYTAIINAHENMLLVSILGIVEALIKLGIAIFITIYTKNQLIHYGLLMAVMAIILLLIARIYCHIKYPEVDFNIKKYYSASLMKEMSNFAGWSLLGNSVIIITNHGQGIILNMFFGTAVNAAQGVSTQISGQIQNFSDNMIKALNPVIVKSEGAKNFNLKLQAVLTGSKISYFLFAIFAIPVIFEMPYILNLWLKKVPDYTIIFATLILLQNLISQPFKPINTLISATGRIKGYQIGNSILTSSVLLFSYLIFKLGYPPQGMYVIFLISVFIRSFGLSLYYVKKHSEFPIKLYFKEIILRSVIVTIIPIIIILFPFYYFDQGLFRLVLTVLLYMLSFISFAYFLGLNKKERAIISEMITTVKRKFLKHKT
ncbi:hypothetical protein ACE1ET_07145 [Saccharicrinis sp. FJH62]|uniref:hypothetical protein n=1 Tax=Saccharicrinis sp. FJH62 TaxID=3344657 RepID=UPI0035D4957F